MIVILTTVTRLSCECFQEDGGSQSTWQGSKSMAAKGWLWLRGWNVVPWQFSNDGWWRNLMSLLCKAPKLSKGKTFRWTARGLNEAACVIAGLFLALWWAEIALKNHTKAEALKLNWGMYTINTFSMPRRSKESRFYLFSHLPLRWASCKAGRRMWAQTALCWGKSISLLVSPTCGTQE